MMKKILGAATVAALAFGLAGCSGASGADTTCGKFKSMSSSAQKDVVTTILKDKGQSVNVLTVAGMQLSAKAYCTLSGDDATLRGLDG